MVYNDEELFSKIDPRVFPGIVDNIHLNRVASLCYAMIELLKFGREYSTQVVRNSQALAKSFDELGVPVKCKKVGYTKSHQVLLNYNEEESVRVANLLEDLDIIVDTGIRVGTSEVTRRGMKENEMELIAEIIADALLGKEEKDEVIARAHKLVHEFRDSISFTLKY